MRSATAQIAGHRLPDRGIGGIWSAVQKRFGVHAVDHFQGISPIFAHRGAQAQLCSTRHVKPLGPLPHVLQ